MSRPATPPSASLPPVESLDDRALLVEIVTGLRALNDALHALGQNPMVRTMVPGGLIK